MKQKKALSANQGRILEIEKSECSTTDDAARAILGGDWRMPTLREFSALTDATKYTWTWATVDGVSGYNITSIETNNSIFLPAAGTILSSGHQYGNTSGYYWTSTASVSNNNLFAYRLFIDSTKQNIQSYTRYSSGSIRPVSETSGVDMGMTINGKKIYWSKSNLKNNGLEPEPFGLGDFFAWGETYSKNKFELDNYKFSEANGFSKYLVDNENLDLNIRSDVHYDQDGKVSCIKTIEGKNIRPLENKIVYIKPTNSTQYIYTPIANARKLIENGFSGIKYTIYSDSSTATYSVYCPTIIMVADKGNVLQNEDFVIEVERNEYLSTESASGPFKWVYDNTETEGEWHFKPFIESSLLPSYNDGLSTASTYKSYGMIWANGACTSAASSPITNRIEFNKKYINKIFVVYIKNGTFKFYPISLFNTETKAEAVQNDVFEKIIIRFTHNCWEDENNWISAIGIPYEEI